MFRQAEAKAPGAARSARPRPRPLWGPYPQMNRSPLGQGKAAGCPQGKEEARIAPPPRPPDPLFPPPPPHDLPSRFPQQARPEASYPCLPSSLPQTGVRRRAARPARRPGHPPRPAKTNPLGHPLRLLQGGPRRPGGAGPGGGGGLPWIPAAVRTRCQGAQGRDGAGGVAESMDGHLVEGVLAVGVHGTPSFLTP
jgi:hypothetical protein